MKAKKAKYPIGSRVEIIVGGSTIKGKAARVTFVHPNGLLTMRLEASTTVTTVPPEWVKSL